MTLGYDPQALAALAEAAAYYEGERPGLGHAFQAALVQTERNLLRAPFAQVIRGEVRSRAMQRFPYRLFYTVDEVQQHIQVLAVIHAARDPDLWPGA